MNGHIIGFLEQTQKLELHMSMYSGSEWVNVFSVGNCRVASDLCFSSILSLVQFDFLLFFSVLIYNNEYQTKENQN